MDFGAYPPEVNSGRMYAGPGSGPMMAAARAWENVAGELYTTIGGYRSAVSGLTGSAWSGPSSAAMSASAGSYVAWLTATAERAEQTAGRAWSAIAAYEAAFAATVPPPEIAANRALLAMLVATNFFGQNTPAIAATEALYAEMWAQDAAAMYTYAGSSAAAGTLTPFTAPQPNAHLNAAVGEGVAASVDLLGTLVTISIYFVILSDLVTLYGVVPADLITAFGDFPPSAFTTASGVLDDDTFSSWDGVQPWPGTGPAAVEPFAAPLPNLRPGGLAAPTMTAALGEADMVGALTVPPNWIEITTAARSTALSSADCDVANTVNQMGIGAIAGAPPNAADVQNEPRAARPVSRTEDVDVWRAPRIIVTDIAAAIRDIAGRLVAGQLSEQEFIEQKQRLLDISFGLSTGPG